MIKVRSIEWLTGGDKHRVCEEHNYSAPPPGLRDLVKDTPILVPVVPTKVFSLENVFKVSNKESNKKIKRVKTLLPVSSLPKVNTAVKKIKILLPKKTNFSPTKTEQKTSHLGPPKKKVTKNKIKSINILDELGTVDLTTCERPSKIISKTTLKVLDTIIIDDDDSDIEEVSLNKAEIGSATENCTHQEVNYENITQVAEEDSDQDVKIIEGIDADLDKYSYPIFDPGKLKRKFTDAANKLPLDTGKRKCFEAACSKISLTSESERKFIKKKGPEGRSKKDKLIALPIDNDFEKIVITKKRRKKGASFTGKSKKVYCTVCRRSYEAEWIRCCACMRWTHVDCSTLSHPKYYFCPTCLPKNQNIIDAYQSTVAKENKEAEDSSKKLNLESIIADLTPTKNFENKSIDEKETKVVAL